MFVEPIICLVQLDVTWQTLRETNYKRVTTYIRDCSNYSAFSTFNYDFLGFKLVIVRMNMEKRQRYLAAGRRRTMTNFLVKKLRNELVFNESLQCPKNRDMLKDTHNLIARISVF